VTVWGRVTESFDRLAFLRSLQAAVSARNKIMHFRAMTSDDERTVASLPNLVRVSTLLLDDLGQQKEHGV
jgi:hypothetical protein